MQRLLLFLFIVVGSHFSAQENIDPMKIVVEKTQPILTKPLFQDADFLVFKDKDQYGNEVLKINFGESQPIEIDRNGNVKVQNKIIAKNLFLENISQNENINTQYITDLSDLEKYLKKNKKLPRFPTNEEMQKYGVNVGDFQMKLLKEIEDLNLIVIDQNKRIESMEKDIKKMKIIMVNKSSN